MSPRQPEQRPKAADGPPAAGYAALIRKTAPRPPALPLVATFGGPRLRTLVELDHLNPTAAADGGPPRLALAYGKPVFRPFNGRIAPGDDCFAPVVMLLDPSLVISAIRVTPFVGAVRGARATAAGDPFGDRPAAAFDLSGIRGAPRRIVQALFGANAAYLDGRLQPDRRIVQGRFQPWPEYVTWLNGGAFAADPRRATVEVALGEPVVLSSHLRAIVAPTFFLRDRIVTDFLSAFDVAVFAYAFLGGRAEGYLTLIDRLVRRYLAGLKVVDHD